MPEAPHPRTASPTAAQIRALTAEALEIPEDEIGPDDDLFDLGLDSLRLIRLAAAWRRHGLDVGFDVLAETPTLAAWEEALRSAAATTAEPAGPDTATPGDAPFPLGLMQHAYWIGRQDGQPLGGVGAHFYVEFDGHGVDPGRLATAVTLLRRRHDMLRTTILDDGTQRIRPAVDDVDPLTVHDLRALDGDALRARLDELRDTGTHRRMDVERGEVFLVALSLLPGGATRLHVDLDMIAADAASLRLLMDDLRHYYTAPETALPPITGSFAGYLAQRTARRADERAAARDWWQQRLPDLSRAPELPAVVDALHADGRFHRTTRLHHTLSPADRDRLATLARRHSLTPAAVLATAFAEVLAGWSAQQRFLLNLPLFDRDLDVPGADRLVGDFSSSVLLDVDLSRPLPFAEQARGVQGTLHQAIARGSYPGVEVLRDLSRLGDGTPVLAPVVYTSALGLGEIYPEAVQAAFGRPVWIISQGPQVWLDAQVTELDGGLLLNWDVRADAFAPGTAEAAFDAYRGLIGALLSDESAWERPVGRLVPDGQLAARARINDTGDDVPAETLPEKFFAWAAREPDRIALRGDGETTYGALADAARRVATLLHRHGVRPGDSVAITLPKGAAQVVAVLGVLAAGAAYVPIGVDAPPARQRRLHTLAGVAAVLSDAAHRPDGAEVPVLDIADAGALPPAEVVPVDPEAVAYVIFTSGSTGEPKGVEVPHRAVVNTLDAVAEVFGVGADDRTIALSALDFDLSAYDMFALLRTGGSVVVVDEPARRDAYRWAELIRRHRVTVVSCVPALLDMLLSAAAGDGLPASLRLVMLGGDWVGLDQPARLRALVPGARFAALGGMTEAAIHSTVYEVGDVDPAWRSVPYGVPLRNMRVRIADERGRDRPDFVPGELWVSGAGVAHGYRGDPARTAEKFVEYGGRRWYRTGDRARYHTDGTLEFLGRADHQVKIRGHRIELGEVEAAADAHPAVIHAVATVVTGATRQLGLYAATGGTPLDAAELRHWLAGRLAVYMVPEHLIVAETMPLTANGKLDRRAVAAAFAAAATAPAPGEPPRDGAERQVAEVWAELLGVTAIGRDDSFFALGGDSLLATRMISRLRERGLAGAGVAALFAGPALRDFAATLTAGTGTAGGGLVADPAHRHEPFGVTDVQAAYLIGRDDRLPLGGVGTWHYSEFDGADVDLARLERAWRILVDRHDMLRAVFDGDARQRVLPTVPPFTVPVAEGADALQRMRTELSHRRLPVDRWPLFEVRAVRYPDPDGTVRTRIGVGLDYLIFDALSIMLLYRELDALYTDPDAALPPVEATFRDYVLATAPAASGGAGAAREHWTRRLDAMPPAPALPLTGDPATVSGHRFTRRQHELDPDRWQRIQATARAHGLTPSAVLLACYAEILRAWSGQDAVSVTLTLFNRLPLHPHVDRVLGDFTTLAMIGHRRTAGESFLDLAGRLHRTMGEDLDHRDVPAGWLLRELARRTGGPHASIPVVFTSAIGVGEAVTAPAFGTQVWGVSQSPQVLLDNQVTESGGRLRITWDAVEDLFAPGVLDDMFTAYTTMVERLDGTDWARPPAPVLPARQAAVRATVNDTAAPLPGGLLHDRFFALAAAEPAADALLWQDGRMSRGELAGTALRIAGTLAAHGVRPGDPVGVSLPKGADQVAAVLGVLAAGGVYVPIGVDQPAVRRERMHTVAGLRAVIGGDIDVKTARDHPPLPAPVDRSPGDLAYLIFTSGSTGEPKAVAITHAAALNTVADVNDRWRVGPDDRVLAVSALDFDLSVYDVFGLLGAGGALVLPGDADRRDPTAWLELLDRHPATLWNSAPVLLDMLLTAAENDPAGARGLARLRAVLVSGDWVGLDLPGRVRALAPDCRFTALGGATEASIWSNAWDVGEVPPHWTSIPYGVPLTNQRFRVVDPAGLDAPDLVPGELWIGGAGVAAGYHGDAERTAARFVTGGDGVRWYRTGDLGRYWADGTLEFLGRADHQVKIGGHRVELGEIEAALRAHPGVTDAVVLAPGGRGTRRLHAFVVARGPVGDLPAHLADRLPAHAIPHRIVPLDALPLTANGKVDRAGLAALTAQEPAVARPPAGPVETELARLWESQLGTPAVDRTANFFTAGGDSLLALRLVAAVSESFGTDLSVRTFLTAPTIADLAAHLATTRTDTMETGTL
ncbi:non-ribosomal peptide synthetase [Catenuloplanes indicus]|uniref:Phenyloxazoline synthase MbtB n=1 Tax=Catenuloplanes indicus TaxID=137267 RepID=A0AAE4AV24_9ACTN|nr:non-ribosomal peptide synthetase [Catenuloplanes indicus]MDQ0363542.1 amino acid adenylation domain-containing protein [Catenuloplanes indicus]